MGKDGWREYRGQLDECLSMEWVWHNLSSFLLSLQQIFIECTLCSGDRVVNKTKAHLSGASRGFPSRGAVLKILLVKICISTPPRMQLVSLLRAGAFVTYSSRIVGPSLTSAWFLLHDEAVGLLVSRSKAWERLWGDSSHPLVSYVFGFLSLPLETQSPAVWPLSESFVFLLAEVRIWRAILLMD